MLNITNLHNYQSQSVNFIKDNKSVGLFLDMGLGKTVSTLTAVNDLLNNFDIIKPLVIAPLRVANTTWHKEAENWEHLKHLTFSIVTGTLANRVKALNEKADIYVINRENITWIVDYYKSKFPFDMLIIDESSSFKNHASKRFRSIKKILKYINRSVILTGTPSPNGYMDIWSQLFILDEGERLGKNITMYRNTYFDVDYTGYSYSIKQNAGALIQSKIKDIVMYVPTKGNVDLPKFIPIVIDTPMDKNLMKKYKEFENDFYLKLSDDNSDVQTGISATSASVLSNKLMQFSSGQIYDEDKNIHHFHDLKYNTLDEIIEENPNDNILLAYNFKFEKDELLKRYKTARVLDNNSETVADWNEGKIKLLIASPASAGHGLNLQHGGSLMIWLGFNWSLELYQQFNKRLHRQGQKKPVRCIHIAVGDIEYKLMSKLSQKNITQKQLMEGLL